MPIGPRPICYSCRWLNSILLEGGRMKCTAFPAGIPLPILRNEADHRKPYSGDSGIRFAQVIGDDAPEWDRLFPPGGDL